eukprot:11017220-Lingulodinium_polyedra.AAC.1
MVREVPHPSQTRVPLVGHLLRDSRHVKRPAAVSVPVGGGRLRYRLDAPSGKELHESRNSLRFLLILGLGDRDIH